MDIVGTYEGIRRLLTENWSKLPEDVREALFQQGAMGASPVDRIVKFAELVYARRDIAPPKFKALAVNAFRLAVMNGWHDLPKDQRGELAALVLEGSAVANPPAAKEEFLPPVPPPTGADVPAALQQPET